MTSQQSNLIDFSTPPVVWLRWFDKVGLLDVSSKLTTWYNEQLTEKELAGDLPLVDSNEPQTTTAPPVQDDAPQEKTSKYQQRYDDFKLWLESENPPLDEMTKQQIHECLKKRDITHERAIKLWEKGFFDWWKQQDIYKAPKGRPKKSSRNRIT